MSRWGIVAEIRSAIKASKLGRRVPVPCHGGLSAGPGLRSSPSRGDRSRRTGDTQQSASTNPFRRVLKTRVPHRDPKILAGVEGVEPANAGIKIRCLNQLGDTPTQDNCCCQQPTYKSLLANVFSHCGCFTSQPEDAFPDSCICELSSCQGPLKARHRAKSVQIQHFPSQSCVPEVAAILTTLMTGQSAGISSALPAASRYDQILKPDHLHMQQSLVL